MLSVSEAQSMVFRHVRPLPAEFVPLTPAVLGLVLAEDAASDLDLPPYDKAMMDGYAVRVADLSGGVGSLRVIEEIAAGHPPRLPIGPGEAARIMTGAPLPGGADAVVMVERTRMIDDSLVRIEEPALTAGKNIMPRGQEMRRGDMVLSPGAVLRPPEFGLLAAVGRTAVKVYPPPEVAVLSTGDELVEVSCIPGPGQIRNSNGPMLLAQVSQAGGVPRDLGIVPDQRERLRESVMEGLQSSILLLSGGVSVGKFDLAPEVLQEMGVQAHFHKVAMKPGKPVFFGTWAVSSEQWAVSSEQRAASSEQHAPRAMRHAPRLVFGLPGNPVAALICFELFVRPAIRKMKGHADPGPQLVQAVLAEDFSYKTDRQTYYPARLEETAEGRRVSPRPWLGSSDLRTVTQANAFVLFPPGEQQHRAGQHFSVLRMSC